MSRPQDVRYMKSHEWARLEGSGPEALVAVGISDHAIDLFNREIVYVELPPVGKVVRAGETFGVVESVKAASDVYAPVSGTIVESNTAMADDPAALAADPYAAGWLVRIRPSTPEEFETLLSPAAYDEQVANEAAH